jgi:molecular chaperone HscB
MNTHHSFALVQNAFSQLGLEPTLELDVNALNARFESLRTQFHPDRFSIASGLERRLAVQRAADINAAYDTLIHPLKRAQLLLELNGMTWDEARTVQDHDFLMQQMQLREALENANSPADRSVLRLEINGLWSKAWTALQHAIQHTDNPSAQRELQRLQFLQRFLDQIPD